MITDAEVDKALAYLRDNAEKDAQARAERLYLEQWIRTVLSEEQMRLGEGLSVAASEIRARTSDRFKDALTAYRDAIHEDERRRFLRSAAEARIEAYRTQEATRRAEAKGYS